ncbi:DNA-J related domain-containing protein [Alkalilimnicola ehrlichii MLHE-1]|uniref:DNA-J related domain-containing protein n=1 Tax=Alkalilimnicola ehrlichii TaxID=351052 RepID=UPI00030FB91B|nr:DNA-J related domain-containing protein [Alkalilimnicola ehrlichii]
MGWAAGAPYPILPAMHVPPEQDLEPLLPQILTVLRANPDGLSEFELVRALDEAAVGPFRREALRDTAELFRSHFLLFHCLYRLRQRLRERGEDLLIHCTRIALAPGPSPAASTNAPATPLSVADPLAAYYLDLKHLAAADLASVEAMLADGWRRIRRGGHREQALAELELREPVSDKQIRRQYRRLVMRHHPDRGGDTTRMQQVVRAMETLGLARNR